jgi:hypothetical protein
VSVDGTVDEAELNEPEVIQTKEGKVSFKDDNEDDENQKPQQDLSLGSDTMKQSSTDESLDKTPVQELSRDLKESRDSIESHQTNTKDRLSEMASSVTSR